MPDQEQMHRIATRMNVAEWIALERKLHADPKWNEGDNRQVAIGHIRDDPTGEWYADYVRTYLHRAATLGLDNPLGRQALGKAAVTLMHMLETVWEVHGPLPEPGVPSGEVR